MGVFYETDGPPVQAWMRNSPQEERCSTTLGRFGWVLFYRPRGERLLSTEGEVLDGKWVRAPRRWFVFGDGGEVVDLSDGEDDVVLGLPKGMAEVVIEARDRQVEAWLEWAKRTRDSQDQEERRR